MFDISELWSAWFSKVNVKQLKDKNICHQGEVLRKNPWPASGASIAPKCTAPQSPGACGHISSTDAHWAWETANEPPGFQMLCMILNVSTGASLQRSPRYQGGGSAQNGRTTQRNTESFIATQIEWLVPITVSTEQNLETYEKEIKISHDMLSFQLGAGTSTRALIQLYK